MAEVPGGDPGGGSLSLGGLIDAHGPALAWDLPRAGLDLWDVIADLVSDRPARSPRYMLAVLQWLPVDGPAYASFRGGRHWLGWTPAVQAAADLWDLTAAVAVGQGGSKKKPKPPTYPRPKAPAPPRAVQRPRARLSAFPGAVDTRLYPQAVAG